MKPNATTKFESLDDYAKKLEHDTAHILECAEVYDNCGLARKKLLGNELTAELFDSLNSIDEGETHGGLDSLLGRIVIPSQDPSENRALKTEILGRIEKNSDASVTEMTSALECYCEDLIRAVTDYDAYVEENSALREKIISGIKGLSDEDKTKFFEMKMEFKLLQCNNIIVALEDVVKYTEFLSSDQMNLGIIKDIAKKNSGDMSDEDKQFLKELKDAYKAFRDANENHIWTACDDSFINSTLTATGYDPKKLADVIKESAKVEKKYISVMRKFKEALLRDTDTESEVMVKNSEFWSAIDHIMCFSWSASSLFNALNKQFALISKTLDGVVAAATPPENPDDNQQQQDDNQQPVDNPNPDDNGGEDNNTDDNSGGNA